MLVNAPKKSGPAVARNRFKRRVRAAFHALLGEALLRERPLPATFVMWVRPARGSACTLPYRDIEAQLRRALDRMA